jgi:hypothetical protein
MVHARSGHFLEPGFNPISLYKVAQCWLSDIETVNADVAFYLQYARFCTMTDILIRGTWGVPSGFG